MLSGLTRIAAIMLGMASAAAIPAAAQDILPDAPKEVRDFRLDAPPAPPAPTQPRTQPQTSPQPQSQTQPQPQAAPASTVTSPPRPAPQTSAPGKPPERSAARPAPAATPRTASPTRAPAPRAAPPPSRPATSPAAAPTGPADISAEAAISAAPPPTADEVDANAQADEVSAQRLDTPMARDSAEPAVTNRFAEWLWLVIAGAAALLLLIALLWRKKRRAAHTGHIDAAAEFDAQPATQPAAQPDTAQAPAKRLNLADPETGPSPIETGDTFSQPPDPQARPHAAPKAAPELEMLGAAASAPQKPRARPELEMRFIPESATLGFANLNLRGELKITNIGKAMARGVTLSTTAICASEQQQAQIDMFFNTDPAAQTIDNIRKGDRLTATIEIMIPRSELSSYAYQDREICIPIILAHIAYHGVQDGSDYSTRLCAMIGREAVPPGAKLGPLRIDQGPRSFDGLGQRDITM